MNRVLLPLLLAGAALSAASLTAQTAGSVPDSVPTSAPGSILASAPGAGPLQTRPLNEAIDSTLRKGEFAWRLPREKKSGDAALGPLDRFFAWMKRQLIAFRDWTGRMIQKVIDWWRKHRPESDLQPGEAPGFLSGINLSPRTLLYTLGAVLLALGIWMWLRFRRARRDAPVIGEAYAAITPDLTRDEVTADQLPESGWLALARDLMARGETRLALRALYLASLADLAQRGHLTIARAKTNREYQRELKRRARPHEGLQAAFNDNMNSFEEVWYGEHAADPARVARFSENLERMRADG